VTAKAAVRQDAPAQSLARGAAGAALLSVEHALNGSGTWGAAHAAITAAFAAPVDAGPGTGLFYGAPAMAFVLHAARSDGRPRYEGAYRELTAHATEVTGRRLARAARRDAGQPAGSFRETDLFYGLAGLGALLLRAAPGSQALDGVLRHVTSLTEPLVVDGAEVPGWWAAHDPDLLAPTPGGHANLGMAHGTCILALLSLAARQGHVVPGQLAAIGWLRDFLARWRQDSPDGPWWPQWLTLDDLRSGAPGQRAAGRPSWCYGAPGIARALQLAAIAADDSNGQADAEHALAACLSPPQLARLTGPGLCHGTAGLYMTALRAAQDAITPEIGQRLPAVAALLAAHAHRTDGTGLLTGAAGVRLALEAARSGTPRSEWDACLLIT
jgi:lantibiotic biosynthesis protein